MIIIDNKLISSEVVEEQFICNLAHCKGGCCEEGDAGAPLEHWELEKLETYYPVIEPYMVAEGIAEIKKQGIYTIDSYFGNVTPIINDGICAYGIREKDGTIKCAIENAYNDGKLDWKKPISCHLFPIKTSVSKSDQSLEFINYEPREDLCKAACALGKEMKMPVYQFLKEPLIRKYGEAFYDQLEATAQYMQGGTEHDE